MSNTCVEFGHDITGTTANIPANAEPGQRYYDQTTGTWKVYNGTDWQAAADAGSGGAAAGNRTVTKTVTAVDNTNGLLATISVPNLIAGGVVRVTVTGIQGDGDSVDSKEYLISVSRVAGANAKALLSSAVGDTAVIGATSTATTTISLGSVGGGVTAVNTFAINCKVARSAGTATNHIMVAEIQVLNGAAGGITVA